MGIADEAKRLHYVVNRFILTPEDTPAAFTRMLRARGIGGIILDRLEGDLDFFRQADWSPFAMVTLDRRLEQPLFHTVDQATHAPFLTVFTEVVQRGYGRIGVALYKHDPPHPDDDVRLSALLLCQHRYARTKLKILVHHQRGFGASAMEKLQDWLRVERPEVLIALNDGGYRWAHSAGFRIPEELACAALVVPEEPHFRPILSGWREDYTGVGRAAVDLLDQMLRRGEHGIPAVPMEILIPGHWQEGETLPARTENCRVVQAARVICRPKSCKVRHGRLLP
jgi:LacI family transcriptional regulator